MSSEVKRYDAVHLRYEDNNIRYGEGCEVEVVTASDYAAIEARLSEARKVLEWIAKWGYGDGGRECAEKASDWLEKHGANQTGGRGHE